MKADPILKGLISTFLIVGFFILASASIGITASMKLPSYYFILRQFLTGGLVGLALLIIGYRVQYKLWRPWAIWIFLLSMAVTAAVFLPGIGFSTGGASRWLSLGPLSFQPSEFLKFGFVLYLAAWFSSSRRKISSITEGLVPFLVITAIASLILILQPDIGTLGVLVGTGLFMFIIAGGKFSHLGLLLLFCVLALALLVYLEPYRMDRVLVFLNPDHDPLGAGYQIKQALIAIGSGGIFGRGFGMSRQKFQYLPEPVGDSVFAVAAEEFGFIGSIVLIMLFIIFAWRGFYIARSAPDTFGKLLGSGIVVLVTLQSLINIAALSGLAPLTGIPLIFISLGGSALAMTLLEMGILLNISRAK